MHAGKPVIWKQNKNETKCICHLVSDGFHSQDRLAMPSLHFENLNNLSELMREDSHKTNTGWVSWQELSETLVFTETEQNGYWSFDGQGKLEFCSIVMMV